MAIDVMGTAYPSDPAAGVAGLRTLGTGAQQAAAGNHATAISSITATGTANSGTYLRGDGTWAAPASSVGVIKPSATSITNSTVATADPHLQLTLTVGTWAIDADIYWDVSGGASNRLRHSITFGGSVTRSPYGGTIEFTDENSPPNVPRWAASLNFTSPRTTLGITAVTGTTNYLKIRAGMVATGSGTLVFNWAQGIIDASNPVNVRDGSLLVATKIA